MGQLKTIIKLVLALGLGILIIWLSQRGLTPENKSEILQSFKTANYWWVILSIFIGLGSHLVRAARWRLMLEPMGYHPSLKNSFKAVMVGYFTNLGIPRSGELARCTILFQLHKIPVNKSFGTVIVERSIDLIIFLGLFFITMAIEFKRIDSFVQEKIIQPFSDKFTILQSDGVLGLSIILVFALLFILFLVFRKRILQTSFGKKMHSLVGGLWEGLKSVFKIKKYGLFLLYTLFIWVFYYLMVYLCFFALPETSGLSGMAGLSILVLGTIAIIVTPGGIGAYPVIAAKTVALYGIVDTIGLSFGWITWSAQTLMIVIFGSISLVLVSMSKRKQVE